MGCPHRERILIALDMTEASSRDRITGLFRHIGKMRHWEIRLIQTPVEFTPARLAAELADGVTGIIACTAGSDDLPLALARVPVPVVTVDVHSQALSGRRGPATYFHVDDRQIGKAGAAYLASTNPVSFGFVPWPREIGWSSLREQAFCREVARRKGICKVFDQGSSDHERDRRAIKAWLRELEKPVGIMCASDERAMQVLEVCDEPELAVPRRIAVLGVDDDECYCDYSKPTLSSIALDYIAQGCLAAEEMERLLVARHPLKPRTIILPYREIVERQSTRPFDPAENLIKRVKKFIADNASKGINVEDVAIHLGVSRRLLDLRFRQYSRETVAQTIENHRLEAVRHYLRDTDRSLRDIASRCGFSSLGSLRNLFRLRMGESMRDYRKHAREEANVPATSASTVPIRTRLTRSCRAQ